MAFREEELKKWEPIVASFIAERRPREELRSQVDLDYTFDNQSIEIFELRPHLITGEMVKIPVAKTTYVRKHKIWKVYWQRADLKWHRYDPLDEVETLDEFINEVKEDPYGCFWG